MSAAERFRQAWDARFPSEPPPDLPCLHVGQDETRPGNDSYGSVYGTVYSSLNPAAVEQALQVCNASIAQLYLQLERQQFVAEYLWEVLHGISAASVDESPPPPPVPKHSKVSSRAKDRAAAVTLQTDLSTAGPPHSGLDSIIPVDESPSSSNFSPPLLNSVGGKVSADDEVVSLRNAKSSGKPVPDSNVTDLDKCHQQIKRKNSLPLLDREQNNPEFESESERLSSLDSNLTNNASVTATSENNVATPVSSSQHRRVTPSPSMPGQKAHRQKPVPTPRVTVSRQATSSYVNLEDVTVGESSTDDVASHTGSGNDPLQQLQRELKNIAGSDSFNQLSARQPAHGSAGSESVSSVDEDEQKGRSVSVKERALAFKNLSSASNTPSSAPGSTQKLAASDNLPSPADGSSPRSALRRTQRVHAYEEIVPVKQDTADSDEGGTVSSDDEEPLYYNLKILQQTMLNRAKTFYSKGAQRPVDERSKEVATGREPQTRLNRLNVDDTHQLSGDSGKYCKTLFHKKYINALFVLFRKITQDHTNIIAFSQAANICVNAFCTSYSISMRIKSGKRLSEYGVLKL